MAKFTDKITGDVVEALQRKDPMNPEDFKAMAKTFGDRFAYDFTTMEIVEYGMLGNERVIKGTQPIKPEDWAVKNSEGKIAVLPPDVFEELYVRV